MDRPGDDADLVSGLKRGDAGAFDRAYARYHARIHRFLCRLCGRRDLAEDLLQETWLRLARHASRLRDDTDLLAWLLTVARNQHRSHRRWAVVDSDRLRAFGRWWRFEAPPAPEALTVASAAGAHLAAALAALPVGQREVLLLVVAEGLPPARVAALLGISEESVRQRLSRARRFLGRRLQSLEKVA